MQNVAKKDGKHLIQDKMGETETRMQKRKIEVHVF